MGTEEVNYLPTEGLTYDPTEDKYWNQNLLQKEITRVFEVCNGCRMCFKYCSVFHSLFNLLDNKYEGDVRKITIKDRDHILKQCFQCKLCEFTCPYTPRDVHEFQVDFPKLVHRWDAHRWSKPLKLRLTDRILGDTMRMGKLARLSLGMINIMNKIPPNRWMMHLAVGIHRHKLLPKFPTTNFEKWAKKNGYIYDGERVEAILFHTCFIHNNEPEIGIDTVEVLKKNEVDVRCIKGMKCCGMPAWEHGDLKSVRKWANNNLDLLLPAVEKGAKVLVLQPTCSMMMKMEWPELLEGHDRERAVELSKAIMSPSEYLWSIRKEDRFNTDFLSIPKETIAYHAPCHLRAQRGGFKGRDLIRKVTGNQPKTISQCSGHDGTFAMRVQGFEESQKVGKKAFDGLKNSESEIWVSDCPLAAVQFQQHAGRKAMHPMSFLARVYKDRGFNES